MRRRPIALAAGLAAVAGLLLGIPAAGTATAAATATATATPATATATATVTTTPYAA